MIPSKQSGNPEKSLPSQTDAELYLALRAGHTAALGVLYDRHVGLVYGLAFKILGNPQEAEDLTQDIFLNLARISAYEPNRGTLRTFLAILTRSCATEWIRSRSKAFSSLEQRRHGRSQDNPNNPNVPFEPVLQAERPQEVRTAIAQLSDGQQEILQMAYNEGLSPSEIAERLEISLDTVKAKSRQGLLKLRQTLTDFIT